LLTYPADKPFQADVGYIDISKAGKGPGILGFGQIKTAAQGMANEQRGHKGAVQPISRLI
jgi:hypothetical protein